jgi:thioredoxin reductase
VVRPDACCGAGSCLVACPNGSLTLARGAEGPIAPRLSAALELLDRPGVHLAGDATGGALIRSALEQGTRAARAIAQALGSRRLGFAGRRTPDGSELAPLDVIVVGAGPAGLATGLEALRHGLDVLVLEQASIAESIRRFSRDKLVLGAAANGELDVPLWVGDARKEELVRRWLREVHARRLCVRERTRVSEVRACGAESFRVRAVTEGESELALFARRVVIATGSRGSPRRLAASVPDDAMSRVHYDLSDARAFAGRNAVVIGLGDVAMETALALALQPGTTVTLVHRGTGFSRGRQQNVEAIGRLAAAGRIDLLFGGVVRSIHAERLVVELAEGTRNIPYDALFVHIGSEAPARIPLT